MTTDEDARRVIDVAKDFGDRYAEISAVLVPESDRYPEGIKYSMQYGTTTGETIVRYDNFPDHPDAARHHRHNPDGSVENVEFTGLEPLYQRFKDEVTEYGHDW